MQVDDDVDAVFARPLNETVEEAKALGVVGVEELVVDGDADRVEAHLLEAVHVSFRDVGFAPLAPEGFGLLGADQLIDEILNLMRRLRAIFEVEHVAFGLEPVAEVGAAQHQWLVVAVDEIGAGGVDEAVLGLDDQGRADEGCE